MHSPCGPSSPSAGEGNPPWRHWREITGAFLKLGCVSFGGPVAHLGYLHDEFVRRRRWLDDAAYADLVTLCQLLPGPTSSQLVFALGRQRAGLVGAALAAGAFTLPSAVLMMAFAWVVSAGGDLSLAGWVHGLELAVAVVVAQAVGAMGVKLCPDRPRILIAVLTAVALGVWPGALTQVSAMAAGALCGGWVYRSDRPAPPATWRLARRQVWAAGTLVACALLLFLLPALASATDSRALAAGDRFYRAGALVFGGGHVVLPLLRAEFVLPGWVSERVFLAGYGAAQALPGPLFTFAAYLGAMIDTGHAAWVGSVIGLVAIFLPGWMLVGGVMPFWRIVRERPGVQAALLGTNAAVVGILLAVLAHTVFGAGLAGARDWAVVAVALGVSRVRQVPPWLLVVLLAAAGQWLL